MLNCYKYYKKKKKLKTRTIKQKVKNYEKIKENLIKEKH